MRKIAMGLLLLAGLEGCAAVQPVVYPNDYFLQSGLDKSVRVWAGGGWGGVGGGYG